MNKCKSGKLQSPVPHVISRLQLPLSWQLSRVQICVLEVVPLLSDRVELQRPHTELRGPTPKNYRRLQLIIYSLPVIDHLPLTLTTSLAMSQRVLHLLIMCELQSEASPHVCWCTEQHSPRHFQVTLRVSTVCGTSTTLPNSSLVTGAVFESGDMCNLGQNSFMY